MLAHERATEPNRYPVAICVLIVASLALLFGPGLREHVRFAMDPWRFNNDARQQIWPFLRYLGVDLFRNDYIADYYLANIPLGYRLLYSWSAPSLDPRVLSKILPYAELLVILYALAAAAWRLAGPAAAWGTCVLCLSTSVFLSRIAGGLPRSFAFPLIALTVLALVRGKTGSLVLLTFFGVAFYYPIGLTIGLVTALYLLVMPSAWQGDSRDWTFRRRAAVLSTTAAIAALLALPALIAVRPFGPALGLADLAMYPETGRGGRYQAADLPLRGLFSSVLRHEARAALLSDEAPWNPDAAEPGSSGSMLDVSVGVWLGISVAAGIASLLIAEVRARRLLPLMIAPCLLYPLALALWPRLYLPARYVTYVAPVLVVVLLPAVAASLLQRLRPMRASPVASAAVVVAVIALLSLSMGDREPSRTGIDVSIAERERPLYQFLASLPLDATIAGWPGGPIEDVPYLSGRKILLGFEVHQTFHRAYVDEMRRRMEALIDAYFAADLASLVRLRRDFGVTHLLINRTDYDNPELSYFAPFTEKIARARHAAGGRHEAVRQAPSAAVFEENGLILLALDRIPDSAEPVEDASRGASE